MDSFMINLVSSGFLKGTNGNKKSNTFAMVRIAGILLKKNNKFLFVREKQSGVYGLWNLPAGHVDEGESLQEAASRECKEETGLEIEVGQQLLQFTGDTADHEVHIFEGKIVGGEIAYDPEELLDAKWLTKEEIKTLPLRSANFRKLFES